MNSDLKKLLELLKSHDVQFLVVGSHLLALYARPRFTEDIDLWIERTQENALRLAKALRAFGYLYTDESALKFVSGRNLLRLGEAPNRVDFLAFLGPVGKEMSFEVANGRAVESDLLELPLRFLSKDDFIASKKAAGRTKDLLDLALLEEVEEA